MKTRFGALTVAICVLVGGVSVGYLMGTQAAGDTGSQRWEAQTRTASRFYEELGSLGQYPTDAPLADLLSPEFTDQRLAIQQTFDRTDFMRAAIQEARAFPQRQFVPVRMTSDRGWVLVLVNVIDVAPGQFGGVSWLPSERLQRELLSVQDDRIAGRIVLEGAGSVLRSLEPVSLWVGDGGTQTIKISRHDFDAYASEQPVLPVDTLLVAERGRFSVRIDGANFTLDAGESLLLPGDRAVSISNETNTSARLFALDSSPIDQPAIDADTNQTRQVAPGVAVATVGQSQHFLPDLPCLTVTAGFAVMAPGERLPTHRTTGFELLLPTTGTIEVRSQDRDFLRTDAARQWQDEAPFAAIEPGLAVAAPPGSLLSATVTSQEPAGYWMFAAEPSSGCSSSGSSSDSRESSVGDASKSAPSVMVSSQMMMAVKTHH